MTQRVKRPATEPPCLPDVEIAAVRARWRDAFSRTAPELMAAADVLLARISPPHWALEWSLPRWLGDALGVPQAQSTDLVLANVYGLAYVRLQDDLVDGDVSPTARTEASLLAAAAFERWMSAYIALFGRDPAFWDPFERYLGQWRRATLAARQQFRAPLQEFTEAELTALAHRGAPLKVCAAGVYLLAGRQDLLPSLEVLLDTLLAGAVLLDHAMDWAADLAAGRPNAFIAHASPSPQAPAQREANRSAVLSSLATGMARPYFVLIRTRLQAASDDAQGLGLSGLCGYVAWLAGQVASLYRQQDRAARQQLRAVAAGLYAGAS